MFENISIHLSCLDGVKVVNRDNLEPHYSCNKGVVWFDVTDKENKPMSLGVFLSHKAQSRYSASRDEKIISGGLIFQDSHLDVIVKQDSIGSRAPINTKPRPQEETADSAFDLHQNPSTGLWGFTNNLTGARYHEQWDSLSEFSEGRAVVEKGGLYGLIDSYGRVVIECEYDELSWDGSMYAYVDFMGEWGVFSRQGEPICKPQWEWIADFSHGFAVVRSQGKYGYINLNGDLAIEAIYDEANSFSEYGAAYVRLGKEKFHIDSKQRRM